MNVDHSAAIKREEKRLRAAQARGVMPLIAPLLDAWEAMPFDLRDEIEGVSPGFGDAIEKIAEAMESAE